MIATKKPIPIENGTKKKWKTVVIANWKRAKETILKPTPSMANNLLKNINLNPLYINLSYD